MLKEPRVREPPVFPSLGVGGPDTVTSSRVLGEEVEENREGLRVEEAVGVLAPEAVEPCPSPEVEFGLLGGEGPPSWKEERDMATTSWDCAGAFIPFDGEVKDARDSMVAPEVLLLELPLVLLLLLIFCRLGVLGS